MAHLLENQGKLLFSAFESIEQEELPWPMRLPVNWQILLTVTLVSSIAKGRLPWLFKALQNQYGS